MNNTKKTILISAATFFLGSNLSFFTAHYLLTSYLALGAYNTSVIFRKDYPNDNSPELSFIENVGMVLLAIGAWPFFFLALCFSEDLSEYREPAVNIVKKDIANLLDVESVSLQSPIKITKHAANVDDSDFVE